MLRSVVDLMGEAPLGFSKDNVGLHLIRVGGAMAMFLSGVATIIIQCVRRWESLAFLEYICKQVETFTLGVLKRMLKYKEFHHLNEEEYESHKDSPWEPSQIEDGDGKDIIPYSVHILSGIIDNYLLDFTQSIKIK